MKKTLYIALFATLGMTACTDELFQVPITDKESSNFFKSEVEIEEAVNGVYAALQFTGLYNLYIPALGEISSDDTFDEVPANDNGIYGEIDEFTTVTSNALITRTWRDSYIGIQRSNTVLNRIDNIAFVNPATKNARIGEMKFIRALLYFNLVRLFGDVPLVVEETKNPNDFFGKGRTAQDQVYTQIKADLTDAVANLPVSSTQPGRVIKTAAQALLGKVLLTLKDYNGAKAQLQAVVSSGKHSLLAKPEDIFAVTNENNAEIIFSVQFASGINGNTEGSSAHQQFSPSGTVSGAKGHNLPTKQLVALYSAGDLRKNAYVGTTAIGIPFSKKLTKPTTSPEDGASNFVVLRYADVLLMLAEVENELNNPTGAAPLLNQVRKRAGLADATASTQADLRAAIELERRLEFIGEGHRWFDLLRSGKAVQVMNDWFKSIGKLITINSNRLLMPIPQSQIDTDPAIKQNPGY